MKICIISCFDWYNKRVKYLKYFFEKKGLEVICITSDFNHIKKDYVDIKREELVYIHTLRYRRNISIMRILSHYCFACSAYKVLIKERPEYIYCLVPPNFLVKKLSEYRRKNPTCKWYIDMIDMWPESFPFYQDKKVLKKIIGVWKNVRDRYINDADIVFTECNLYQTYLQGIVDNNKMHTLYLVKNENEKKEKKIRSNIEKLTFAYLGSINNIVDLDMIYNFLVQISEKKKVRVRIIAAGERKQDFVEQLDSLNIECIDEGEIYNEEKKCQILSECDFGLNIMKKVVCIGLTTKSIDYFEAGLPIINSIPADTEQFVTSYNAGYNLNIMGLNEVVKKILDMTEEDMEHMHSNAYRVYKENFTPYAFEKKIEDVYKGERF